MILTKQSRRAAALEPALIGEREFRRIIQRVERLTPTTQYTLAVIMVVAVFAVDVITGPEIALSILYLAPIGMVAWHRGWTPARIFVLLSGAAWLGADVLAGHEYSFQAIRYWNALVRTSFFFIIAFILSLLRRSINEEQRLARTDHLTGAANGRWFLEVAAREVARQRRYKRPLSVAFLDCDNFKHVNDDYGHAAGDDLLRRIATALTTSTREVDLVARLGGDEFAILMPETGEQAMQTVYQHVRAALKDAVVGYNVTFSIGLATYNRAPGNVDELLRTADEAMYEAKNSGKNASHHRVID